MLYNAIQVILAGQLNGRSHCDALPVSGVRQGRRERQCRRQTSRWVYIRYSAGLCYRAAKFRCRLRFAVPNSAAGRISKRRGNSPRSATAPPRIVVVFAGSLQAAGLPPAGAELAAVDDAVVLVAGGAEHRLAAHRAVADLAVEEIADRAALVTRGEGKLD